MKKKNRRLLWGLVALLVIGGVATAFMVRARGGKDPEVQTTKVSREKIVQTVNGTGKLEPRSQVKISADVSARITRLAVKEGQWVEKGAFLLELDRDRYLAAIESAEATVRSAQANASLTKQNMENAKREYDRSQALLARGMEAQSAFDAKQNAYQVEVPRHKAANEAVAQAQAALKQARSDLSKTTIYAPMSGTVSSLNKELGEIALGSQFQSDVILVIADLSVMEAEVNVDENDIVNIKAGQAAKIQVDALAGPGLDGTVREIGSSANPSGEGTTQQKTEFEIKITILNPPESLRPGMTATADIVTKTNDRALSVPLQCVALRTVDQLAVKGEKPKESAAKYKPDPDGFVPVVFVVDKGRAVARQVTTGIQSQDRIEILSGLAEGDEVVSGSYRAISKDLANGAVIRINNSAPPDRSDATASRQ